MCYGWSAQCERILISIFMMKHLYTLLILAGLFLLGFACSKSDTPTDPCTGVTVTVSGTVTNPAAGAANGSINAMATGANGYTYSINNGTFQPSGLFNNLAAGTYTVTAKTAAGCTGSATFTLTAVTPCSGTPGPLFTAVKTLVQTHCVTCHNAVTANGGVNLSTDCAIVSAKERIRVRAVLGTPTPMPTNGLLEITDRQKITDWINAGGRLTD